jgi:hypothetical protein
MGDIMVVSTWTFSEAVGSERRRRLKSAPPYENVAREVAESMRILCTHPDPCDEAAGYMRLVACVIIDRDLFDLWFNAESGYRGRFFDSPGAGVSANSQLMRLVAPALVSHESHRELKERQAEWSMSSRSAKCWLAEVGKGFCPSCEGEWSTPQETAAEILNGRWELSATPKALYGRKAPRLTKLPGTVL